MSPEQSHGPAARRALRSVLGGHRALPAHDRKKALRRADRPGRADAGAAGAAREAVDGGPRHEPGRRAVHQPRLARRPRQALAERRADGGPDRRHPGEAGAAERAGAAQALAGDAERARRRQAARPPTRRPWSIRASPSSSAASTWSCTRLRQTIVETGPGHGRRHAPASRPPPARAQRAQRAHAAGRARASAHAAKAGARSARAGGEAASTAASSARFKRWARRMTIRAALILVVLGGGLLLRAAAPAGLGQAADRQPGSAVCPPRGPGSGPRPGPRVTLRRAGTSASPVSLAARELHAGVLVLAHRRARQGKVIVASRWPIGAPQGAPALGLPR